MSLSPSTHTVINIAGCCISRDVFSMHENDGGYKVARYISAFSPLLVFDKGLTIDEETFWAEDTSCLCSNFLKRCFHQDTTRTSLDWLSKTCADYILLDSAPLRKPIYELENGILCYGDNKKLLDHMASKGLIPRHVKTHPCDFFGEEEMDLRLKKYADAILASYRPDQIILLEVKYKENYYRHDDNGLYRFRKVNRESLGKNIAFGFNKLCEHLKGCHVIPMPEHVIGDFEHKGGPSPLHYVVEYYDYALACINLITQGLPIEEERSQIHVLARQCSELCKEKQKKSISYLNLDYDPAQRPIRHLQTKTAYCFYRILSHMAKGKLKDFAKIRRDRYRSMLSQ